MGQIDFVMMTCYVILVACIGVLFANIFFGIRTSDWECQRLGYEEYNGLFGPACEDSLGNIHFVDVESTGAFWWSQVSMREISVGGVRSVPGGGG